MNVSEGRIRMTAKTNTIARTRSREVRRVTMVVGDKGASRLSKRAVKNLRNEKRTKLPFEKRA